MCKTTHTRTSWGYLFPHNVLYKGEDSFCFDLICLGLSGIYISS